MEALYKGTGRHIGNSVFCGNSGTYNWYGYRTYEAFHQKKWEKEKDGKNAVLGGICCGLVLCFASLLQQIGIQYTTVGKAGFITTLYIIIVPIMGIFLKKRVSGKVWIGALLAAFGMYLLCMSEKLALSKGDAYVFICAILFSIHILVIDYFSPKTFLHSVFDSRGYLQRDCFAGGKTSSSKFY